MLSKFWIELRSSLWFVPGLLVIAGIGLALGLIQLDVIFADALRIKSWQPLLNAGAEGARGMLSAIAGSMVTVAATAFSVTIVTLSLASSQYTPRILRNFMRDRANQYVLGVFLAIFAYCVVAMRTIRGGSGFDGVVFVPLLAVAFAVLLALVAIGTLIFFIHHVAASIQVSSILESITKETYDAAETLFPDDLGEDEGEEAAEKTPLPPGAEWHPIRAETTGYLQHIDPAALMRFAKEREALLRLECGPGDFVAPETALVSSDCQLDDEAHQALRRLFIVGDFRTVAQDVGFGIRQIVDIALKALSPGVNDTSTAVSCLDYLGAVLSRLAGRRIASPYRGKEGELRVIAPVLTFDHLVAKSLDEIRLCAEGNVTILRQMFRLLARVAPITRNATRHQVLLTHARLIRDLADRSVETPYDRGRVSLEIAATRDALQTDPGALPPLPDEKRAAGA